MNDDFVIKDTGKYGSGVYANREFKKGETVYVLSGEIVTFEESIRRIHEGLEKQTDSLQVDLEKDMDLDDFSRIFNHSCDPNTGIRGISELFALRDIKIGDQITYDYSVTIGPNIPDSLWSMDCHCGSKNCRKVLHNIMSIPKEQLDFYKQEGAIQDYNLKELSIIDSMNGELPKYNPIII